MRSITRYMGSVALPGIAMFLLLSCSLFEKAEIIHPEAEITSIQATSDTSVTMSIDVTRQSNAGWCEFYVKVARSDSLRYAKHVISNRVDLEPHYQIDIGGLIPGQLFTFQLASYGSFDLGGPNQTSFSEIGAKWEYTIP